jgi:ketosteroid isomerase-like protein
MSQPDAQSVTPEIRMFFDEGSACYNCHDFDAMMEMYTVDAVLDVSRVF